MADESSSKMVYQYMQRKKQKQLLDGMMEQAPNFNQYMIGTNGVNPNVFHPSLIFETIRHGQSKTIANQIQLHNVENYPSRNSGYEIPPAPIKASQFNQYFGDI